MTSLASTVSATRGLEELRRDFVASLPRRLDALTRALTQLAAEPGSGARREDVLRRVHASAASARSLGLELSARVLEGAAARLQAAAIRGPLTPAALADLERTLTALTEVVAQDRTAGSDSEPGVPPSSGPICVLVLGSSRVVAGLTASGAGVEVQTVERADDLPERALALAPDVVVVDADQPGCREAVEALTGAGLPEAPAIVVVGTFDAPEAAAPFAALGAARVLPRPASPEALLRAVRAALADRALPRPGSSPIGTVTIATLADRLADEVRRGLVGSAEAGSEAFSVPLGEGVDVLSAVWGSVARVRELVTMRSGGAVRFRATGPEGAILLAPWAGGDRRTGVHGRRQASSLEVPLARRRAVIVDDDPAVVWFLSDLLQRAGVEVLEAHDGDRALDLVLEKVPDLVIADVLMPGRDGFSLARELKRDVAVRDVPVILLSWKEDLLERARELGADAEGYLLKEAAASVVLERVREVLRPRARIEARLQAGQEVRGRLDGLTPRLVLELACARGDDARVAFRDAAYLYEVEIRRGRPRSVTRTAPDGRFARGEAALAGLLGAAAGRFVVTPGGGPCACDFDAPLAEVLGPPVARARAALRALAPERVAHVAQVSIDVEGIDAYLATSPRDVRSILQRLGAGVAPIAILADGTASPRVLADVLADVARRGAVLAVLGADGEDLLRQLPSTGARRTISPAAELPTPSPMFTFALSPAPALMGGIGEEAPGTLEVATTVTELPAQPSMAESLVPALPRVMLDAGEDAGSDRVPSEPGSPCRPPSTAEAAPRARPDLREAGGDASAGGEQRVAADPLQAASTTAPPPSGPRLPRNEHSRPCAKEGEPQALAPVEPGFDEGTPAPALARAPERSAAVDERAVDRAPGAAPQAVAPLSSAPVEAAPAAEGRPTSGAVDSGPALKPRITFPARSPAKAEPPPRSVDAAMPAGGGSASPPTTAPGASDRIVTVGPAPIATLAAADPPVRPIAFPVRGPGAPPPAADLAEEPEPQPRVPGLEARPVVVGGELHGEPDAGDADLSEFATSVTPPGVGEDPACAGGDSIPSLPARARRLPATLAGVARVTGITVATAVLSFGLVRLAFAPAGAASLPAAAGSVAAPPLASVAAPPAASSSVPPPPQVHVEALEVPPGFVIGDGKGLLEIVTPGRESIYVGGTFVGRGPTRRVPLAPGAQSIEIRTEDGSRQQTVELPAGRRLRVAFGG